MNISGTSLVGKIHKNAHCHWPNTDKMIKTRIDKTILVKPYTQNAYWFCNCVLITWLKFIFCLPFVRRYNYNGYVYLVVIIISPFLNSWLTIEFLTKLIRRVSQIRHELLTLPEHLSVTAFFCGGRVAKYCFEFFCVDLCLSSCQISFDHSIVPLDIISSVRFRFRTEKVKVP